eukprot:superscaffoldBa00007355_g22456
MRIEEELGAKAKFAGKDFRHPKTSRIVLKDSWSIFKDHFSVFTGLRWLLHLPPLSFLCSSSSSPSPWSRDLRLDEMTR